ncbi:TetR family transcriptional regulator [Candidatus Enterococcus clewellii]|uniref:HTH tetR-type domain-containing protein n=1 Tax=Candidatus Enterococcus clewellii TaxID=1834193 RepID=A0A242KDY8_9ENTE|nr:TetR family transcriptional regulator [Enterococcus sp. 9E7_DIV0242]OTP19383.1 hypothetical protein A5888_001200 [Enterococcus sp. 9E7_DIV0242]
MGDLRTVKSKKLILHAFEVLLQEHTFEEISVTKLSEEAGISRNTFYIYYLDKYSLLDEQFSWFNDMCSRTFGTSLSISNWTKFLDELDGAGAILKNLLNREENQWVREKIKQIFADQLLENYTQSFADNELTLIGCAEAMAGIIERWMRAEAPVANKKKTIETLTLFQALIAKDESF